MFNDTPVIGPFIKVLPGMDCDNEGRLLACEFEKIILISVYTPHSGVGELKRLEFRVETWDRAFQAYIEQLNSNGKPVVVCGDLNIIRHDADIYNTKWVKEGRPGLTERERASFE